ncbi:hypothetical protein CV102_22610 [Natronococcus pandeyae]|uniref:Uncharacterized protein n=1 Tax=Natronococcus pandeyae TaxID=2055836 RepID=A0A8J8Q3G4_9EURY|nr:hypothetical protein [Natronococcus pandeyae]TYL36420.1 hypothetical protein CV102_22610 [Natronococcus pandeyae]
MNIFVEKLASGDVPPLTHHEQKLIVEDNIGEGIHVHFRNVRLEMSIEDYLVFSEEVAAAAEVFNDGDC